jgi:hypothetical protein
MDVMTHMDMSRAWLEPSCNSRLYKFSKQGKGGTGSQSDHVEAC